MAQWEREEISERVAASVPIRAKLGKPLGGAAPFGYRWEGKNLIPDPKEAAIRKLMYELFLEHKRKKTVARMLNERGYRTRKGENFSDTTVDRLLRNPTAKGVLRANYTKSLGEKKNWKLKPKDEWVFSEVEAIIPQELWDRCNAILDEHRNNHKRPARKSPHLFTGFVHCLCGQKMYVPSNTPKYVCYDCRNKIPVADLDSVFQEQLKNFLLSPSEIMRYLETTDQVIKKKQELFALLEDEERKLRKEIDRLFRLHSEGQIPTERFGEHYRPLNERLTQLEEEVPQLQGEIDFLKIQHLSR